MQFFTSMLAFSAVFTTSLAAPTAKSGAALEERQTADAYAIVSDLYTTVQQYTGAINSTAASLNSASTAEQNATAAADYRSHVTAITNAVNAAQAKVAQLEPASRLMARQTSTALASLVENLLLDISGALDNIIGTLGLTSLLSGLTPLVTSLSGLLLSLEVVVNNLLALVQQLLDGLLTGLSVGLAGLTL